MIAEVIQFLEQCIAEHGFVGRIAGRRREQRTQGIDMVGRCALPAQLGHAPVNERRRRLECQTTPIACLGGLDITLSQMTATEHVVQARTVRTKLQATRQQLERLVGEVVVVEHPPGVGECADIPGLRQRRPPCNGDCSFRFAKVEEPVDQRGQPLGILQNARVHRRQRFIHR